MIIEIAENEKTIFAASELQLSIYFGIKYFILADCRFDVLPLGITVNYPLTPFNLMKLNLRWIELDLDRYAQAYYK